MDTRTITILFVYRILFYRFLDIYTLKLFLSKWNMKKWKFASMEIPLNVNQSKKKKNRKTKVVQMGIWHELFGKENVSWFDEMKLTNKIIKLNKVYLNHL